MNNEMNYTYFERRYNQLEAKIDALVELFCLTMGREQEDTDQMYEMWKDRVEQILNDDSQT